MEHTLRDRSLAQGFTLVEILLVIVLLGITLGFALVNWQPDDRQQLRRAGERLALLLNQTQSEAIFRGHSIAWQADQSGYRFLRRDTAATQSWVSLADDDPLQARHWENDIRMDALDIQGQPNNHLLIFKAIGLSAPFSLALRLRENHLTLSGNGRQVWVEE